MSNEYRLEKEDRNRQEEAAEDPAFEPDDENLDETAQECRQCAICGEPGEQACMLFIGKSGDDQDLFVCGRCCNLGGWED